MDTNKHAASGNIVANQHNMRNLLNETGPGFCLAKWTQVTMHLGNGLTHSCHHPFAHKIPLEELEKNPGALHNTEHKKARRKEMLSGQRPSECDFCWRVEDNDEISDRVYKSMDEFSFKHHDKIAQLDGDEDVFPTYVEVSFSRTCNFKCAYCGPAYSSQWHQEIEQQGPYELEDMKFNIIEDTEEHILARDYNPYVAAFWQWWPEAYKHMHTFRITGGEPLLSKDTWKVLDFLLENPNPNLEFAINSNGCPPDNLWEKFVEKVNLLQKNKCIKNFTLFTSAEAAGERNDYIRYGMNYENWKKNIEYFLENTEDTGVTFMAAFNLLSISTFKEFLEWVLVLKQNYNFASWDTWLLNHGYERPPINPDAKRMDDRMKEGHIRRNRVCVDTPYIRNPSFLDASICSMDLVEKYLLPAVDFMFDNLGSDEWRSNMGFDQWEAQKLKRNFIGVTKLATQFIQDPVHEHEKYLTVSKKVRLNRGRFYDFVQEYDKRRNTKFLETFPEYADFLVLCKREGEIYQELKEKGVKQ